MVSNTMGPLVAALAISLIKTTNLSRYISTTYVIIMNTFLFLLFYYFIHKMYNGALNTVGDL